jgi:hypothetical protein
MKHRFGTNLLNEAFDDMAVDAVWLKGVIIPGVNPKLERKDVCGARIERYNYGDTTKNRTGWEIDHIISKTDGGGDHLDNLQPLQWRNNRSKAESSLDVFEVSAFES